jgi:hypothetical protein
MHRPFGQQLEDGGAHVAALTASTAVSAASAASTPGPETGSETWAKTGTEARTEPAAWAEAGTVVAIAVLTELLAELLTQLVAVVATALTAIPTRGGEAEPGTEARAEAGATHVGAAELGKWGVHRSSRFWAGNAECASDTLTIYRKLSRCNG